MSIPADKVLGLFSTTSGQDGLTDAQFTALVQSIAGSASNTYCRCSVSGNTGVPNTLVSANMTITINQSGFTTQASGGGAGLTELVMPSTGKYLFLLAVNGNTNANALGDVNTAVACPGLSATMTIVGFGSPGFVFLPLVYTVVNAGTTTSFSVPYGMAFCVADISVLTRTLSINFNNRVYDTANFAGTGQLFAMKLGS